MQYQNSRKSLINSTLTLHWLKFFLLCIRNLSSLLLLYDSKCLISSDFALFLRLFIQLRRICHICGKTSRGFLFFEEIFTRIDVCLRLNWRKLRTYAIFSGAPEKSGKRTVNRKAKNRFLTQFLSVKLTTTTRMIVLMIASRKEKQNWPLKSRKDRVWWN